MSTTKFMYIFIPIFCVQLGAAEIRLATERRWNLVPKNLLKRLCNIDDSLPICAWKRHVPFAGSEVFSKWNLCRDHPELALCRWNPGGAVTLPPPHKSDFDEPLLTGDEHQIVLSSKWSNIDVMKATLHEELNGATNDREKDELNDDNNDEEDAAE